MDPFGFPDWDNMCNIVCGHAWTLLDPEGQAWARDRRKEVLVVSPAQSERLAVPRAAARRGPARPCAEERWADVHPSQVEGDTRWTVAVQLWSREGGPTDVILEALMEGPDSHPEIVEIGPLW